jgi:transcription initiation factor TFIIIB Brf1 subunit/transcription initiation factor TFIIB
MAHFAKIENNTVTSVIVVSNDDCGGGDYPDSEPIGQAFIASLGLDGLNGCNVVITQILEVAGSTKLDIRRRFRRICSACIC